MYFRPLVARLSFVTLVVNHFQCLEVRAGLVDFVVRFRLRLVGRLDLATGPFAVAALAGVVVAAVPIPSKLGSGRT